MSPRLVAGALIAVVAATLVDTPAAAAEVLIEELRPGVVEVVASNETNAELIAALARHYGFTPDIQDAVWASDRTSFRRSGSAERLLTAVLKGTSYLFGYSDSPLIPSSVTVLPTGSSAGLALSTPISAPEEAAPSDAGRGLAATTLARSGDGAERSATAVSALLQTRAQHAVITPADQQAFAGTPLAATQEHLAALTRRTLAGVLGLAEAIEKAEREVAQR